MSQIIRWISRIGDKAGSIGAVVAAMGCAACFPAIASLGAVLGLGFLSRWEGLFLNTLLPVFAWLALVLNALGWVAHRQWHRSLLGMLGPALLLLSLYPWFRYDWSTDVTYAALGLMVAVSAWDIFSPASRRCDPEHCELPAKQN